MREEPGSGAYFTSLGTGLIVIGIILSIGSIILLFTAASSGTTYDEGRIYMSPAVFAFLIVMSLVFLATGMALMAVAKRLKKDTGSPPDGDADKMGEKTGDGKVGGDEAVDEDIDEAASDGDEKTPDG